MSKWKSEGKEFVPKPKSEKLKKIPFEDLVIGHKFKIIDVCSLPKGEHSWCDFCGGRLMYYVLLKREDGKKVKVGMSCVEKAGYNRQDAEAFLEAKENPDEVVKEQKNVSSNTPHQSKNDVLDDDIRDILDNL